MRLQIDTYWWGGWGLPKFYSELPGALERIVRVFKSRRGFRETENLRRIIESPL